MSQLIIRADDFIFNARFDYELSPETCATFKKAVPSKSEAIDFEMA